MLKPQNRYENFRLVDYTQDKARFYGTEAEASYAINDVYKMSVFGDYVRGKIDNENAATGACWPFRNKSEC